MDEYFILVMILVYFLVKKVNSTISHGHRLTSENKYAIFQDLSESA